MAVAAPIALGLMAAGQLYSGISSADQMRDNAAILKENARRTELTGALNEAEVAREARAAQGEAIAQQGASGVELGTGSALEMLRQNAINAEFDKLNIRTRAAGEAANLRSEAKQLRKQATATLIGSAISAGASVLMGSSMLGGGPSAAAGSGAAAPGISAGAAYRMPIGSSPFGMGPLR